MFSNTMWINSNKTPWAFTLIEILIVIFVLWVGILRIVVLITRNLSLTKQIHLQNNATVLAREGIELAYNYKNTNELLWYERNCAQRVIPGASDTINNESNCGKYFFTGDNASHIFTIEWFLPWQTQVILKPITSSPTFESLRNATKLSLTWVTIWWFSLSGYTYGSGEDTPFARYIEFTGLNDIPQHSPLLSQDIHHISSIVLYTSANRTGEILLESFISNPK